MRRDHYTRATLGGATAAHVALEPPVMQRRSSLRPKSALMGGGGAGGNSKSTEAAVNAALMRNETHPIMHQQGVQQTTHTLAPPALYVT